MKWKLAGLSLIFLGHFGLFSVESPTTNSAPLPAKIFSDPGIATFRQSKWIGSDHLYNLPKQIYVDIELIKQPTVLPELRTEGIRQQIRDLLTASALTVPQAIGTTPPLPLFNMLIYIHQIDKGFVISILARLLEDVELSRIIVEKNFVFQAITWEKQIVILSPAERIQEELNLGIRDLTNNFIDSYKYFQLLKSQQ
jgi:hypothetical protein